MIEARMVEAREREEWPQDVVFVNEGNFLEEKIAADPDRFLLRMPILSLPHAKEIRNRLFHKDNDR
jgi:hypothetical protein